MQKCRKPVPNTTDRQLKTLNGDEPQRAKTFRRAAAAPPSRRAATTHIALPPHRIALPPHRIALPPHRIALPPVIPILSLHNPVIQRE